MTEKQKRTIDGMTHRQLLEKVRFAPIGDPAFQGDAGTYYIKRMGELQAEDPRGAVADSKAIGWKG